MGNPNTEYVMPAYHFAMRLNGLNTRLACGRHPLNGRSYIQLAVTTDRAEVTCKRCLEKLAKLDAKKATANAA